MSERDDSFKKWSRDPVADAQLCERTMAGEAEAGREFYDKYKHLAWHFGNIAAKTCITGVVDSDDLSQSAFEYMLSSAQRFDAELDIPFANYASAFMLHHLGRTVGEQSAVHLPAKIHTIVSQIHAINGNRQRHRQCIMSDEDIANEFNIRQGPPHDKLVTVGGIRQAILLTTYLGSIDGGYGPRIDHSPGNDYILDQVKQLESVTAEVAVPTDEAAAKLILKEALTQLIDQDLDEQQNQFIRLRWGLDGDEPKTLDEIGHCLGVSRERARQIETKTMSILRHPDRSSKLKDFLIP